MSDNKNIFWSKVLPECVEAFDWGEKLSKLTGKLEMEKTLKSEVAKLDGAEFDVFLAQLVIKSSSKGFVGADLTEMVAVIREMRE